MFSVQITIQEYSGSHKENHSDLIIIIKDNFKASNETRLIRTSCNDQRWDLMLLTFPHANKHTHKRTHTHSEYIFHILSTGCVMMSVIKMGNCLTVVPCYWIYGPFRRYNQKQLNVKSLSSELGRKAERTYRRRYRHQRDGDV